MVLPCGVSTPDLSDRDDVDPDAGDEPPFSELFRDFIAFEVKLFLDGLKDLALAQGALIAVLFGFLRRRNRGQAFYGLMRLGERFEHWLGLYRPLDEQQDQDAPFGGANRALREAERRIRSRRAAREEEEKG